MTFIGLTVNVGPREANLARRRRVYGSRSRRRIKWQGTTSRQTYQVGAELHDIRQYMSYKIAWCWGRLVMIFHVTLIGLKAGLPKFSVIERMERIERLRRNNKSALRCSCARSSFR